MLVIGRGRSVSIGPTRERARRGFEGGKKKKERSRLKKRTKTSKNVGAVAQATAPSRDAPSLLFANLSPRNHALFSQECCRPKPKGSCVPQKLERETETNEIGDRCRRRRRRRNSTPHRDRAPRRAPRLRSSPPCWAEQQTVSSPTCARWRRARAWRERREKKASFFSESIKKAKREKREKVFQSALASSRPLSLSFSSLLRHALSSSVFSQC